MNNKKYLTYIGFAIKAGKCGVGASACESDLARGRTEVLLCSHLASVRTREKFKMMCEQKGVEFRLVNEDIGMLIGKPGTNLFSINDEELAGALKKELDSNAALGVHVYNE